jgi:phosphoglycerate dehydrogenase-like enzyme
MSVAHRVSLEAAVERGVVVTRCPIVPANSVAEYTIAVMMYLCKGLYYVNGRGARELRSFVFDDIEGKALCIIGLGSIGRCIAVKARRLGLRVLAYNRSDRSAFCKRHGIECTSFDDVLRTADILSINVALTEQTRFMLNAGNIPLLKPTAFIINTAEADVIDPATLYNMMSSEQIAGLATNFVYEQYDFTVFPNAIVTPHISSRSRATTDRKVEIVIDTVRRHLCGKRVPKGLVVSNLTTASTIDQSSVPGGCADI